MFPIANMTAIFFERTYAHTTHGGYRPAAKKSKIQHANRFSLTERIEHPISYMKMNFLISVLFFHLFYSWFSYHLKLILHQTLIMSYIFDLKLLDSLINNLLIIYLNIALDVVSTVHEAHRKRCWKRYNFIIFHR